VIFEFPLVPVLALPCLPVVAVGAFSVRAIDELLIGRLLLNELKYCLELVILQIYIIIVLKKVWGSCSKMAKLRASIYSYVVDPSG